MRRRPLGQHRGGARASARGPLLTKLLNTYGDIEGIYAHLDAHTPKLQANAGRGRGAGPHQSAPASLSITTSRSSVSRRQKALCSAVGTSTRRGRAHTEPRAQIDFFRIRSCRLLQDRTLGPPAQKVRADPREAPPRAPVRGWCGPRWWSEVRRGPRAPSSSCARARGQRCPRRPPNDHG